MSDKIGTYSKTDFLLLYGVRMKVFQEWIEPIKKEIGWIDGVQQKFPPAKVKIVLQYLGLPD